MPDLPATFLAEQQSLLREIRDELRSSRALAGGSPASGGGALPPPSPNAFVKAQLHADRLASTEFGSFGWSQAYQSQIRSSLLGDLAGTTGVAAPPNTMGFGEYQAYAQENWALRGQSMLGSILGPGHWGQMRQMAGDLYQNSARIFRAGSLHAGPMGVGVSRIAARDMAMQVQGMAAGDLRMSNDDYQTVLRGGLRSGQFDFSKSPAELMQQFSQLKDVVADLTRVTRMSVSEITQTVGTLRQYGVADPADQSRIIRQLDAAARVGGISGAEMSGIAMQAIQGGMGMGIGAGASAGLAGGRLMMARSLSQAGVISPHLMAMGGNAAGIAASQTAAIQGYLGSDMGYFGLLGGGGSLNNMMAGIGATGGTLGGFMRAQSMRADFMGRLTSGQATTAFRQNVESQLSLMGISDPFSQEGQDAAFMLLRGRMGEAGAHAYTREHFTEAGRRAAERARYAEFSHMESREAVLDQDEYLLRKGIGGSIRQGKAALRRGLHYVRDGLANVGEGIGTAVGTMLAGGHDSADLTLRAIRSGAMSDAVSIEALVQGARAKGGVTAAREALLYGTSSQNGGVGAIAGGLYGARLGLAAGRFFGPIGTAIGTVAGGIAGAIGGNFVGSLTGSPDTSLAGNDAVTFSNLLQGATGEQGSLRARSLLTGGNTRTGQSLNTSSAFVSLMNSFNADVASGDAARVQGALQRIRQVAQSTGEDEQTVIAALKAVGGDITKITSLGRMASGGMVDMTEDEGYKRITRTSSTSLNFQKTESREAVLGLMNAHYGIGDMATARRRAVDLGMDATSLEEVLGNIRSFNGDVAGLHERLRGSIEVGGSSEVARRLRRGGKFLLSEAMSGASSEERERLRAAMERVDASPEALLTIAGGSNSGLIRASGRLGAAAVDIATMGEGHLREIATLKRTLGIDEAAATALKGQLQGSNEEQMRTALMAILMDPTVMERMGVSGKDTSEAAILERASNILDQIEGRLNS